MPRGVEVSIMCRTALFFAVQLPYQVYTMLLREQEGNVYCE